jgi:hypothetical protein
MAGKCGCGLSRSSLQRSTDFGLNGRAFREGSAMEILADDSRVRAKVAVVKMSGRRGFSQLFATCLWLVFLALTVRADTCDFVTRAVRSNCTLTWNGLTRQYQLYIPNAYVATISGVVFGLHGSQGSGPTYSDPTILDKADAAGFAVVLPSATDPPGNTGIWQFDGGADGGSSWLWTTRGASVPDDMGFLRQTDRRDKGWYKP